MSLIYDRIAVMGESGYGKGYLVERLTEYSDHFIFFDPSCMAPKYIWEFQKKRVNLVWNFHDLVDEVAAAIEEERRIEVFYTPEGDCGPDEIDEVAELCFKLKGIDLYMDEMHVFVKGGNNKMPHWLDRLTRLARHRDTRLIGISQRYTDMNVSFRSQCDRIVTVRQTEPNDLEYFKKYPGPVRGQDLGEFLSKLPKCRYYFIK